MIVIIIAIFIALSLFYYTIQKGRIRKQQRRERLEEKQEELLQALRNKTKDNIQKGAIKCNTELLYKMFKQLWFQSNNGETVIQNMGIQMFEVQKMSGQPRAVVMDHFNFWLTTV